MKKIQEMANPPDRSAGRFFLEAGSPAFWEPKAVIFSSWSEHVPFAFWLTHALAPSVFVELGTHHGMSYLAFCQAVAELRLATRCFAVDTWAGDDHAGRYGDDVLQGLRSRHDAAYGAFSTLLQLSFNDAAKRFDESSIELLHIDGLHTYEAVRHDFEMWLPKMAPSSVILFHDTRVLENGFGVHRFWAEIAAGRPHFEFHHGNGLGVLGIGSGFPNAVEALFRSEREGKADDIRGMFQRLGGTKGAAWSAAEIEARYDELQKTIERIKEHPVVALALKARRATRFALNKIRVTSR